MDARYCALSRVSFGLNTGGVGAGSGDNLRAPPAPGLSGAAGLFATISGPCGSSPRPCASTLCPCGSSSRPCGSTLRPRGLTLSHLAGVGQCPLAIGHGRLVGLLAGVPVRRPVSPLSSTSACSGAGSGWHGCGWIADSAVNSEGLAPVALAFARACSAHLQVAQGSNT